MSSRRSSSASSASGSKRSRSPDNDLEDAWRRQCKRSAAGSRRAACRYAGALNMPASLREFAAGGRWYKEDPPLKPMSGGDFEKWRAEWERDRASKAAWAALIGSTSGGGSGGDPRAGEEEAEEAEEDAAFLQAVAASEKDDAEKARAEAEEEAAAIAAVREFEAREAAARGPFVPFVILDD